MMDIIVIGGGQSGLAAARACLEAGLTPLVLEAGDRPSGSWPHYYDSLTLFSPARYSSLPSMAFPGDPERYPHRDEVVGYLEQYAADLQDRGVEIRTRTRVTTVKAAGEGFAARTLDGTELAAHGVIAASGSFTNPYLPALPGQKGFTGNILHAADYVNPAPYTGKRIVVVGAGNSAVQIAYELSDVASVTLTTRKPIRFVDQRPFGKDLHFWFTVTGFDRFPTRLVSDPLGVPVLDDGRYRKALRDGRMDRRSMFTGFDSDHLIWPDDVRERVDVVLFATGYRPALDYLTDLAPTDGAGRPRHVGGVSTIHPGLGYLGLEWQRSPSSNTLRGVGRDARYLVRKMRTFLKTGGIR